MLRSSPFFFKKDSGPAGRVVPSNQVKNEFTNVETYNTRQESLKRDTAALEFSRKLLWFIPHTFALTECALSLPNVEPRVFWSAETAVMPYYQHWERGNAHKCFKIFDEHTFRYYRREI